MQKLPIGENMFEKSRQEKLSQLLNKKLDKINQLLQKINLEELTYILGSKKQILFRNFLAGIARGVGIGIGVTVITAIIILILQHVVKLNIPVIGEYIADIIEIVEQKKY